MISNNLSVGVVLGSASRQAGGLFTSVRRLSQSASSFGMPISIYALRDSDSASDSPAWGDLRVQLFDALGPAQLGIASGLGSALVAAKHDLLHQHGIWQGFSATVNSWGRRLGRPVVISPRGMLDTWALSNAAWKKQIAGWLYENANLRQAACLHALNESERISMRRLGLRNPIAVIPNGIDQPPVFTQHSPPSWAKQIPDGARILLFLGRIHPKKGLNLLLQAIAKSRSRISQDWHLVLAGWEQDGHLVELKELAETLSLSSRVHFAGPLHGKEKWTAFHLADAFVLPSHSEGLPMAVLEAWANELPVLMTRACNLPEGSATGAAIEVETNVDALCEGYDRMTSLSQSEREAMGQAGKKLVADRFTWDSIGKQMYTTYQWLLSGGSPPPFVDLHI